MKDSVLIQGLGFRYQPSELVSPGFWRIDPDDGELPVTTDFGPLEMKSIIGRAKATRLNGGNIRILADIMYPQYLYHRPWIGMTVKLDLESDRVTPGGELVSVTVFRPQPGEEDYAPYRIVDGEAENFPAGMLDDYVRMADGTWRHREEQRFL